jgi:hypothetical protein
MSLRQQWRDFVCDPQRAGRHLANTGRSVSLGTAASIEDPVLQDFLRKLHGGDEDITLLASIIDLAAGGYQEFCTLLLPPLLNSLANERTGEDAIVGPVMRGAVRWDRTTIGRMSGRLSPAQFVSRLPVRSFAVPENALVRWLVESLVLTVSLVERRVGSGSLPKAFAAMRDGCDEALRHEWFRQVPPPTSLEPWMRLTAQRNRSPGYRVAASLAVRRERYQTHNRSVRWQHTLELLAANWLEPISPDDLLELYAVVLVLDVLESDLGLAAPAEYGLATAGRDHVARFESAAGTVRVFFDQSPHVTMGYASYHLSILDAHQGIRGVSRRPDVVVVRDSPQGRRVCFIEVKQTADSSYTSDSVYKALGYISDYRAIWNQAPSNPKVVLLFPEDIHPRTGMDFAAQEVVMVSSLDRATVAAAIRSALAL